MNLIKMFLTITAKGALAYTTTQSQTVSGKMGTMRLVTFNNNESKSDTSTWLYTEYTSDDYTTLVDAGFGVAFVNPETEKYYSLDEVESLKQDGQDVSIVSTHKPVDNFVSQLCPPSRVYRVE